MKATGRSQISAPLCLNVTGIGVSTTSEGAHGLSTGSVSTIKIGDSTLTAVASAGGTTLSLADIGGFTKYDNATNPNGGRIIVGYGLPTAEVVICSAGADGGGGADNLTVSALVNDHAINERVVQLPNISGILTPRALRPGSVVVKGIDGSASTIAFSDNGDGTLSSENGDAVSGTVDYSTGVVSLVYSDTAARTVTYSADILTDQTDVNDFNGDGYFKNFLSSSLSRRGDLPDVVILSNIGRTTLSVFFESSKSNGQNFEVISGTSKELKSGCRAAFMLPGGRGDDAVRIRCGAATGASPDAGDSSILEVDYVEITHAGTLATSA